MKAWTFRTQSGFRRLFVLGALTVFLLPNALFGQDEPVTQYYYPTPAKINEDDPAPKAFDGNAGTNLAGQVSADGIAFNYLNNYLMMMQVYEHLRNVPLVTYHGETQSGPASAGYPGYSTGGMNTAPYGPGYAPAYEQSIYNGGYSGYDQNGQPISLSGDGSDIFRGQAQYGDPGTLIYSLWGGVIGGSGEVKKHDEVPGYDTEQFGGLVGLDLFCSSDCRSGLFYGYQEGKIKKLSNTYSWNVPSYTGSLTDPNPIPDDYVETAYRTDYTDTGKFNGTYTASLKTQNHLIGIYHQFGDEFVYNIATLRGGFNKVKTTESLAESGSATRSFAYQQGTRALATDEWTWSDPAAGEPQPADDYPTEQVSPSSSSLALNNKYNEYIGGVSFERGANFSFAPFTITPRGAVDYTFLHREKSSATSGNSVFSLKKGNYHSVRTNLGANLSLDMYPGEQHFKGILRGSWVHEFLNDIYGSTEVTAPSYVHTIKGNPMGRDWALLGAGLEWTIVPEFMIFGNYDYMMNKYLRQSYGSVGAALMW